MGYPRDTAISRHVRRRGRARASAEPLILLPKDPPFPALRGLARISRAAFSRNYRDKYQPVEQIFDEAMAEMTADDETGTRSPDQRWAGFLDHADTYHRLYRKDWMATGYAGCLVEVSSVRASLKAIEPVSDQDSRLINDYRIYVQTLERLLFSRRAVAG